MIETLSHYGIKEESIIWFDAESFEEPEQYVGLFETMTALPGKQLKLEFVVSSYFHQTDEITLVDHFIVVIAFFINDNPYRIYLQCNGWFDDNLVTALNIILDKWLHTSERFYMIKTADQSMIIVFVDRETARRLDNDGLIDHDYHLESFPELDQKRKYHPYTPIRKKIGSEETHPDLNETQKAAYMELTDLCVHDQSDRAKLYAFIDDLKDFDNDDKYFTTLNYVMDYVDDEQISFIMRLDWKAGVEDLEWQLSTNLTDNYGITANLPVTGNYPENTGVSQEGVFADFDKALRKNGLQLGFIDTDADEYIVLLHEIQDKARVEKAVRNIGYVYLESLGLTH